MSSYEPLSVGLVTRMLRSAGLKERVRGGVHGLPSFRNDSIDGLSTFLAKSKERTWRSRSNLKTMTPLSWPAAKRLISGYANGLVLASREDKVLVWMEEGGGGILESVVASRDNEGQCGMEGNPVDTPVVSLEHKLYDGIGVAKHVGLRLTAAGDSHLILKGHRGWGGVLLAQAGDVPDAD
ncbi:hypothetical protein KC330_g80 [Hortaea werneckii]|nr:hypothetical protein KC330_g80 [Hortaea werneckii]